MDTIKMTESMMNGLGKPKDARYQTNLHPTIPIAILEVHGELMKLKMDCFSKHDESAGSFAFEVLDGIKIIASGKAEFSLNTTDIKSVCLINVADDAEQDVISSFVTKCILLLNEFNYAEWKNKICGKNGKESRKYSVQSVIRRYRITPKSEVAELDLSSSTGAELMEILRNEKKSFSARDEKKSVGTTPGEVSLPENDTNKKSKEIITETTRSYVRHIAAWYVRGHYDHHGHYHQFHFAKSKIAVGANYADCRTPI